MVGLGLAGQPVNEGCVGEESILILLVAELSESLRLLLQFSQERQKKLVHNG